MKITPRQYSKLQNLILNCEKERKGYHNYFSERNSDGRDDSFGYEVHDNMTEGQFASNIDKLKYYRKVLENAEVVTKPNLDYVDIGTTFVLKFDEDDEEEFTLVEDLLGSGNNDGLISLHSPVGKAVYHKKDGDDIEYVVGNVKGTMKLKKIVRDKYEKPIRSIPGPNRMSYQAKKDIKESRLAGTYNDEWKKMTESQNKLLREELKSIYKNINSSNKEELANRSKTIKDTFTKYHVTEAPTNNNIGIGSVVSLKLVGSDKKYVIENVEVINRALSDELPSMYLERISNIGSRIYGLSEGDSTIVRIGKENYTCYVTRVINNTYTSTKTR